MEIIFRCLSLYVQYCGNDSFHLENNNDVFFTVHKFIYKSKIMDNKLLLQEVHVA